MINSHAIQSINTLHGRFVAVLLGVALLLCHTGPYYGQYKYKTKKFQWGRVVSRTIFEVDGFKNLELVVGLVLGTTLSESSSGISKRQWNQHPWHIRGVVKKN